MVKLGFQDPKQPKSLHNKGKAQQDQLASSQGLASGEMTIEHGKTLKAQMVHFYADTPRPYFHLPCEGEGGCGERTWERDTSGVAWSHSVSVMLKKALHCRTGLYAQPCVIQCNCVVSVNLCFCWLWVLYLEPLQLRKA